MHREIIDLDLLFSQLDHFVGPFVESLVEPCVDPLGNTFSESFPRSNRMGVAVSGGSDSLATLLVSHEWCQKRNYGVHAFIVDHGLRSASKDEALFVADICAHRKIPCTVLSWDHGDGDEGTTIVSALLEKARAERYRLLFNACEKALISVLITGHHLNDQIETFWMRLQRGSSPRGLSSMKPVLQKPFGYLIRPFLDIDPDIFKNLLTTRYKTSWVSDPSNDDTKFERIRIRKAMAESTIGLNFSPRILMKTIKHCQAIEEHITLELNKALEHVAWQKVSHGDNIGGRHGEFKFTEFKALPSYIGIRLLQHMAEDVSLKIPSNFDKGKRVYERMISKPFIRMKGLTFHGCLISYRAKNRVQVMKERRGASTNASLSQ